MRTCGYDNRGNIDTRRSWKIDLLFQMRRKTSRPGRVCLSPRYNKHIIPFYRIRGKIDFVIRSRCSSAACFYSTGQVNMLLWQQHDNFSELPGYLPVAQKRDEE